MKAQMIGLCVYVWNHRFGWKLSMDSFNLFGYLWLCEVRCTSKSLLNHDYRLRIYRHYSMCVGVYSIFSLFCVSLFASCYCHYKCLCILIERTFFRSYTVCVYYFVVGMMLLSSLWVFHRITLATFFICSFLTQSLSITFVSLV